MAQIKTTIVGSLPKPSWLAKPEVLWAPWQLAGEQLAEGKRDAVRTVLKMQEQAGIDIVGDGEQTRIHFVHGFLQGLSGVDFNKLKRIGIRADRYEADCPTVVAPVSWRAPVHADDVKFARANTAHKFKFTLPGPMTMVDTLADDYYKDRAKLAFALADILNAEAKSLEAAGADTIQFDEPAFNVYLEEVRDWGVAALERAAAGLKCTTAVHICYGYGIKANDDWKKTLGGQWRQYADRDVFLIQQGLPTGDRTLAVNTTYYYCVNVKMPSSMPTAAQGDTSDLTFTFNAEQTANN